MAERKKTCFVIMPFGKKGTPDFTKNLKIYQQMIKPVLQECGYKAIRADELEHMGNITRDIIELLHSADLVVADLSGKNANVFYELGVRHTLFKCGTIPIIRDGEVPPFDIANYRAIFYNIEIDGPDLFMQELKSRIKTFERIDKKKSDNPVYDILGDDFIKSDVNIDEMKRELKNIERARKRLERQNQALTKAVNEQQKKNENVIGEIANKNKIIREMEHEISVLENKIEDQTIDSKGMLVESATVDLGRRPPKSLDSQNVESILKKHDLFDKQKNPNSKGITHKYKEQSKNNDLVVIDQATGLMWQQSGSDDFMTFKKAQKWIDKLNQLKRVGFAGYSDWRLPTLEEAMSLMEPTKKNGDLYIDPIFDKKQRWIWTCDRVKGATRPWVVYFHYGYCVNNYLSNDYYVRAVRS